MSRKGSTERLDGNVGLVLWLGFLALGAKNRGSFHLQGKERHKHPLISVGGCLCI